MGKLVTWTFRELDFLTAWTIHSVKFMTVYREIVSVVAEYALNDYSLVYVQKTNIYWGSTSLL